MVITNIVTFFLVYSPYASPLVEVHCGTVVSPTQRHKRKKKKVMLIYIKTCCFQFCLLRLYLNKNRSLHVDIKLKMAL